MVLSDNYFATKGVGVSPNTYCPNNGFSYAMHRYCSRSKELIDMLGNIPEDIYKVQSIDRLRVINDANRKYYYLSQGILDHMKKELEEDNIIINDEDTADNKQLLSVLYMLSSLCYIIFKPNFTGYKKILATKNEAILNLMISDDSGKFFDMIELNRYIDLLNCCGINSEEIKNNTLNIVTIQHFALPNIYNCSRSILPLSAIREYYIVPYYMMRLRFIDIVTQITNKMSIITYLRNGCRKQIYTKLDENYFLDNVLTKARFDCSKIIVRDFKTGKDEEIDLLEISDIKPSDSII